VQVSRRKFLRCISEAVALSANFGLPFRYRAANAEELSVELEGCVLQASSAVSGAPLGERICQSRLDVPQAPFELVTQSPFERRLLITSMNLMQELATQIMGVRARVYLVNDNGWPKAFAQKSLKLGEDGEVNLGFRFLQARLRDEGGSDLSILAVLAHELAHVYQLKNSMCSLLYCSRGVIKIELHADFLAGYSLGRLDSGFSRQRARDLTRSWGRLGDTFSNCQHHGTADQRLSCLIEGFGLATESTSFEEVAGIGRQFVDNMHGCEGVCSG
jgi:hypothetical protein